jgi:hypothetical protein
VPQRNIPEVAGVVSPWDRLPRSDAHSPISCRNSTGNRIFTP